MKGHQQGFGAIVAIVVLVIMASLAAAITTFSTGQQLASAQDVQATRAWHAAYAGTEWGLYRALKSNTCDSPTPWAHPDYAEFNVSMVCTSKDYNEGQKEQSGVLVARVIRVFRIEATASTAAAVSSPGFIERKRVAVAYCEWDGSACVGP